MNTITDDDRWRAVAERDSAYDGRVYYGVKSTGIYCRPSCPSKRPGRKGVAFFDTARDAQAAGFRACLRCRPDEPDAMPAAIESICRYLESHIDGPCDLTTLASMIGLSPTYFQREFTRITGVSPAAYLRARRTSDFRGRLQGGQPITAAMYDAGYGSTSRAYEQSGRSLGMTPRAFARGGLGQRIVYAVEACDLGYVLVARTDVGLCAVTLGDDPDALTRNLQREFQRAEISCDDRGLQPILCEVLRRLDGHRPSMDLPLDVRATAFQTRVWQELQKIPVGTTITYEGLAAAIDQPAAARAVARACATNPVGVVVPCHRVVRKDGGLGGYRWGLERKRALLERERRQ